MSLIKNSRVIGERDLSKLILLTLSTIFLSSIFSLFLLSGSALAVDGDLGPGGYTEIESGDHTGPGGGSPGGGGGGGGIGPGPGPSTQPTPSDTAPGAFFEGGGEGSWDCGITMPESEEESPITSSCSTVRSATVSFDSGSGADSFVSPHLAKAKQQCNYGNPGGGSINVGAHIKYAIMREGSATYNETTGLGAMAIATVGNQFVSADCIDMTYVDKQETCMASGLANIDKVVPNSNRVASKAGSTPWGAGNHTYEACQASKSVRILLGAKIEEMGRYTLDATVYATPITVRHYNAHPLTGATQPPEIINIGGTYAAANANKYAQLTCDPNHTGISSNRNAAWTGSGWTWTASDCLDGDENGSSGAGSYMCDDNPTVNGVDASDNIDLFRDNEANVVSWGNPNPDGGIIVSSTPKRTKINRSGTPWNSPRSFPANNNNFRLEVGGHNKLTSSSGTSWMPGGIFTFDTRGNWASDSGNPTKLQATWDFDVKVTIPTITITSMEVSTDGSSSMISIQESSGTTTVDSTAKCYGYTSQNFVRAVND